MFVVVFKQSTARINTFFHQFDPTKLPKNKIFTSFIRKVYCFSINPILSSEAGHSHMCYQWTVGDVSFQKFCWIFTGSRLRSLPCSLENYFFYSKFLSETSIFLTFNYFHGIHDDQNKTLNVTSSSMNHYQSRAHKEKSPIKKTFDLDRLLFKIIVQKVNKIFSNTPIFFG